MTVGPLHGSHWQSKVCLSSVLKALALEVVITGQLKQSYIQKSLSAMQRVYADCSMHR